MDNLDEATNITSITGDSKRLGSVILCNIINFNNFDSPDQSLALAGLEPAAYQSRQMNNKGKMVKRGSSSSRWSPLLRQYHKKIDKDKHYFVSVTHAAKKRVRIIYYLIKHHQFYDESKLL